MLTVTGITKTYPGVKALDHVTFSVQDGEVHALLGENGAGKSTLIKAIAGAITPDDGTIAFDDRVYRQMTPQTAQAEGVAVIYQELNLCGPLSVAENIFLGRSQGTLYSKKRINKMAQAIFDAYGFSLSPTKRVDDLPPAEQQLVEICKAISNNAKLLIMDEPTSALATREVELLFEVIAKLKARGVTIVYISHRLDVYLAIACILLAWFVLNKTNFGRSILAVGGNRECARLSGIKTDLVQIMTFAITGAVFGIAALVMMAQQNMTSSTTGPGTEFTCLTAAIIGGISFKGGKGNVFGLVAGIFVMQIIANGMQLAGWGTYLQYAVKGAILLAAISFDAIKNRPRPAVRIHSTAPAKTNSVS